LSDVSVQHFGNYRELLVWQRAIQLPTAIYRCSERLPKEERFGLTGQLRRAAVSIPSNFAEGSGRATNKEYRHFLFIARGSNMELQTQLVIAKELQYGKADELIDAESLSIEVGRMLSALLGRLKTT
jgi:four helix bundle protein